MATFSYDAKDASGNAVSGIIEAGEARGAAAALREQGLFPMRIDAVGRMAPPPSIAPTAPSMTYGSNSSPVTGTERVGAQAHIDIAPFLVSVPLSALAMMYRQLATLMNAGVPMVQALTALTDQTNQGRLKTILRECVMSVSGGNPLSSVMDRHPSVFTTLQIEMIRAGETGGMLEMMCHRIADYLEREVEIRRKLKRETLYPKIVLFVAGLVTLLLGFLRSGAHGALGMIEFGGEIVIGAGALWWLARYLNQFPQFGAAWDNVKMLIPGPGGVARKYATARFARALGTLYAGGVLLPTAVAIAARSCGNRAIGQRLLDSVGALMAGNGISGVLAESGLLSPIAVQMARTGEQTGNLDGTMEKVADYLESEADAKAHQLAVFSGVAALVIAACVVGFIAVSFYAGQFAQVFKASGE